MGENPGNSENNNLIKPGHCTGFFCTLTKGKGCFFQCLSSLKSNQTGKNPEQMTRFLEIARKRYSCRKYDSRQVEAEKLDLILEAGRVAPSAVNFQPWHFYVIQEAGDLSEFVVPGGSQQLEQYHLGRRQIHALSLHPCKCDLFIRLNA